MKQLKLKRLFGALAIAGSLAFSGGAATDAKAEGGTFVWGMSSEMSILDPHVACGWLTTNAIHSMFEGLVMLDLSDPNAKNAKLKPAIAKSWETSDDGTVYTFAIRENVRFHDGTPVDANVVKWNYDRFMASDAEHAFDQAAAYLGYYTRWIKSVEVTGDMTVKITLNQTNYEWLQMGVVACGMPMIVSPTAVKEMGNEQFALNPVGTGPFKFVEREQNIKLVMERNDDYWGNKAKLERLIFQPLPDQATRLNAIRAGEVSMIMEAPWEELENLKNEGFTVTTNENIPSIWMIFFNFKNKMMQDVRVRKAINMAIDRDAIANGILKGTGRAEMGMLSPGTYAYKPGYAPVKYDPEGAKALLAEAGYPDGLELDFDIYEYGYNEVWEKSIQRDLKKIGVNAKLNKIEWITYMGKWLKGMPDELQMNEIGWGWTIPFWTQVMTRCDYHPPNGFNVGWYCNPEVDKLFDEAVKQKDKAKAAALYQQANDIIIGQDFAFAVKFVYYNPLVLSPQVTHFVNPPANWYDFSIIELE